MLACVCECVHVRDRPYALAHRRVAVFVLVSLLIRQFGSLVGGAQGGQEAGGGQGAEGPEGDLSLGPCQATAPSGT